MADTHANENTVRTKLDLAIQHAPDIIKALGEAAEAGGLPFSQLSCEQFAMTIQRLLDGLAAHQAELDRAQETTATIVARHQAELDRLREQHAEIQEQLHWLTQTEARLEREREEARAEAAAAKAEAERLRAALIDFRDHGTRFDCNPTVMIHADNPDWVRWHQWWCERASQMDCAVRNRATSALAAAQEPPAEDAQILTPRIFRCHGCGRIPLAGTDCSKPCTRCNGVYVIEGDECGSCIERDDAKCPASKRWCGHHCNHGWTHDACCWCGGRIVEEEWVISEPPADPTEGLPDDLARVLRDQSIVVPQDGAVFDLIGRWAKAPSDTASADPLPAQEPPAGRTWNPRCCYGDPCECEPPAEKTCSWPSCDCGRPDAESPCPHSWQPTADGGDR